MIPGLNSANISGAEERLRFRQRELRDHRSKPRRRSSEKGQHHLEDPGTYRDQQWEYLAARTRYQLRRLAHSCEIAADVDRVCAEQQRHEGCYGPGSDRSGTCCPQFRVPCDPSWLYRSE
jgi:hypothetical protein